MNLWVVSLGLFTLASIAAGGSPKSKAQPFVLSIKKDEATNLFYTSVGVGTPRHNFNLVIHVAGEDLWYDCDNKYNSSSYILILQTRNDKPFKVTTFPSNSACAASTLPSQVSLCLPSSNNQGFTNLLVGEKQQVSQFLHTTPLLVNPFSTTRPLALPLKAIPSNEYFIDVKAIKIDGHVVNLKPSLLSIDDKGNGGTKISTMTPFTQLQTSLYRPFVTVFLKKASDRRLKRVVSVAPFEACFDSTTIGNSLSGMDVPTIDLVLHGGVKWTIHGANSMVMAKENVACLAFVDGGIKPPKRAKVKTSIVIGGYQLQDNLLVFDVASSKLSFSSSLLLHNTTFLTLWRFGLRTDGTEKTPKQLDLIVCVLAMSCCFGLHILLLSIAIWSVCCLSECDAPKKKPQAYVLAIKKDRATNLFYTSVGVGTPRHEFDLTIDLAGENLWYDCDTRYNSSSYRPVACGTKQCPEIGCVGCNGPFKPGCSNNTCPANTLNPFANSIFGGGLGQDFIFILQHRLSSLLTACIDVDGFTSLTPDHSPLNGLPKNTKGIIGLSSSQLVLPIQLASANNLPPKFSLCLPSSNKQGFTNLLVGAGEHPRGMSNFFQTTPLIVNPVSTGPISVEGVPSTEYFVDVKALKIDGNVVNLKPSLLSIDKKGNGGTKISTITPFTELHTSVYKPFLREFLKRASDRKFKKVAAVAPFEACYDSSTISNSGTGLVVPTIDLVLQGGVHWTIHGANSMIMAKKNVACLAFVDGGTEPRMSFVKASIVIGGYQLQDNLLVFDLSASNLSFTSSLLLHNATCSHH
ncbi:hypothetical protein VNO78_04174 [Psophocarpus tetragonolobus]|uniref:Peptidase A1 domain-containing protein n=1 Tax=Psophocarpus tetragonolobus TaxID=3891 RepID=A0AAN9XXK4_PSOTE